MISRFSAYVIIYAVSILVWFLLWLIVGDGNWWLILLNRIVPFLFIPIPLFLIWGIYYRQFKAVAVLIVPCLIFIWLYYPYLIPSAIEPRQNNGQLSVMTYNVLFSNVDYDAVANVISVYDPDLAALQEVQPEMMSALKDRLSNEYPFSIIGTENEYGTTAIFSKHPIDASYALDLQVDRPAVVIKTKISGQDITFVTLHLLAYNLWWTMLKDIPDVVVQRTVDQNRQVEVLLEDVGKEDGIVIVGCDCNSYETSSSYRIFEHTMSNAAREAGWSLNLIGLPGTKQDVLFQHIDYVWFRGLLKPVYVYKIQNSGGSDHLPVLAIFEFK